MFDYYSIDFVQIRIKGIPLVGVRKYFIHFIGGSSVSSIIDFFI